MPLTIGQLTTEVVTEPEGRGPGESGVTGRPDTPEQRQAVRRDIAVIVRDEMRTRAEGFDD